MNSHRFQTAYNPIGFLVGRKKAMCS